MRSFVIVELYIEKAVTYVAAFFLFVMCCQCASAQASGDQPVYLTQDWLNLSFYEAVAGGYESRIVNEDFFVSQLGRTDPEAEFNEFLNAVKAGDQGETGEGLICRYPARTSFLIDHSLIASTFRDDVQCPDEDLQGPSRDITGLSLVFATGYFGNPSSYYGHVMLEAKTAHPGKISSLLDRAINYGAKVGHSTSNPLYLFNGLFGGYEARFNSNSAFIHTHNYLNHQLRDVWTFDLALTQRQSRFVVEHARELEQARFSYYFFTDNCSHKIAQILEHALDLELRASSGFWFSPFQLVNNLKQQGLIKGENWQASRKTRVDRSFARLDREEKRRLAEFVLSDVNSQKAAIASLSPNVQMTALEYLDMENSITGDEKERIVDDIDRSRQIILQNIYRHRTEESYLDAANDQEHEEAANFFLFDNPPLSRIATKYAWGEDMERMEVSFRPAHNDMLDRFVGGTPPSDFSMLKVALSIDHQGIDLHQFDLIEITTLPVSSLPMNLNSEYAWSLYAGYKPFDNICHRCSVSQVGYAAGWTSQVGGTIVWGMAGGRIMDQHHNNGHLGLSVTAGALRDLPLNNRILIKYEAEYLARSGKTDQRWTVKAAHRLGSDVRVGFELQHNGQDLVGKVGMAVYFY